MEPKEPFADSSISDKIPAEVVFRCLEKMLGLVLAEEGVEVYHGKLRRCWIIRSAREYAPFISVSYDWPLSECDRGCQRRCNVRFASREAAAEAVLERICDFSWCNAECVAVKTVVNPLLGKKSAEELEILLDVFRMQGREKEEEEEEEKKKDD